MSNFASQYMISGPEDSPTVAAQVASQIENGTLKFPSFLLSVQEYAVDDDLIIRAKCIEYISAVLALLKPDTLGRVEISRLVTFLRGRIENNAGVKEASQGLQSLMEMNRFIKKDSVDIVETLFKETSYLQRLPASARFCVYQLIEKSLERCRDVLEGIGSRFIDGVLSMVEFEKDPRNLMIVFSFLRVIMAEFAATEDQTAALWDAVFRYYPIRYRPKPEDNIQITKQDLQRRLEACLTSNSRFAPYAFPALLAKLDQEINATVKVETLTTLAACVMAYSVTAVNPHWHKCWTLVKTEAFNIIDAESSLEGAKVLRALVAKTFEEGDDGMLHRELVKQATRDILDNMETATLDTSRKAGIIVTSVASGSPVAFSLLLQSVMPALLTIWQDIDGRTSEMNAMLKLLNRIVDDVNYRKASTFYTPVQGNDIPPQSLRCIETFGTFREKLLEMYDFSLRQQETSLRTTAIKGLVKLAQVPRLLSFDEIGMTVQSISAIALTLEYGWNLRQVAIESLEELSSISEADIRGNETQESYSNSSNNSIGSRRGGAALIESIVFPELLRATTLPAEIKFSQLTSDEIRVLTKKLSEAYEVWSSISSEVDVFDAFLKTMKVQLEQALNWPDVEVTKIVLATVEIALKRHITRFRRFSGSMKFPLTNSPINYVQFVKELFKLILVLDQDEESWAVSIRQYKDIYLTDDIVQCAGRIALFVFRSIEAAQQSAANDLFTLFVADGADVKQERLRWNNPSNLAKEHRRSVVLTKHLLASLRSDAKLLAAYDLEIVAGNIISIVRTHGISDTEYIMSSFSECLGTLVNKFGLKSVAIESEHRPVEMVIREFLEADKNASPTISLALQYTIALVKKGEDDLYHAKQTDQIPFLNYLINFFDSKHGELGSLIATAFRDILDKSKTLLIKKNHALVSPKYQRKFYHNVFPILINYMDTHRDDPSVQKNCLVALTGVIEHVSGESYVLETNPITPMLKVLNMDVDGSSKRAALELMLRAIETNPKMLTEHLHSVYNRLEDCMDDKDYMVRAMAVHSTGKLASAFPDANQKYKIRVLRRMSGVVGDSDEMVRTEAVDATSKWMLIDGPEEE